MKVWTCTEFTGHWPVGTAAVVVAETALDAALTLNAGLRQGGLDGDATEGDMIEVDTTVEHAIVLRNGDY